MFTAEYQLDAEQTVDAQTAFFFLKIKEPYVLSNIFMLFEQNV